MEPFISAVVLAGGKSRRMGFDKQFIKINGQYLIERIVDDLCVHFDEIIIISNSPRMAEVLAGKDVAIYKDHVEDCGPLGGIYTGLTKASADMVYVSGCDMPNINGDYIDYLKSNIQSGSEGLITKYKAWIEPLNAFYSKSNLDGILDYLNTGKKNIHGYIKTRNFKYIEEAEARKFSNNWDMFDNLNSEEDLLRQNLSE